MLKWISNRAHEEAIFPINNERQGKGLYNMVKIYKKKNLICS